MSGEEDDDQLPAVGEPATNSTPPGRPARGFRTAGRDRGNPSLAVAGRLGWLVVLAVLAAPPRLLPPLAALIAAFTACALGALYSALTVALFVFFQSPATPGDLRRGRRRRRIVGVTRLLRWVMVVLRHLPRVLFRRIPG